MWPVAACKHCPEIMNRRSGISILVNLPQLNDIMSDNCSQASHGDSLPYRASFNLSLFEIPWRSNCSFRASNTARVTTIDAITQARSLSAQQSVIHSRHQGPHWTSYAQYSQSLPPLAIELDLNPEQITDSTPPKEPCSGYNGPHALAWLWGWLVVTNYWVSHAQSFQLLLPWPANNWNCTHSSRWHHNNMIPELKGIDRKRGEETLTDHKTDSCINETDLKWWN